MLKTISKLNLIQVKEINKAMILMLIVKIRRNRIILLLILTAKRAKVNNKSRDVLHKIQLYNYKWK